MLTPRGLPAVARVVLKEDALAKSHRPRTLFSKDTCPIIGAETFGNLLVSVRPAGLGRLEEAVGAGESVAITADLSTVNRIEPYSADDAAGPLGVDGLKQRLTDEPVDRLKFRLFRHRDPDLDERVLNAFKELAHSLGLPEPEALDYLDDIRVFRIRHPSPELLPRLAAFVGTQSVRPFPRFRLVAQYIPQGALTVAQFPAPDPQREYPVVGLIDSGTDPGNPLLQAWVVNRDEVDVPRADQDNNHGSFVGGLIANSRILNHGDERFPAVQAKLLDVVAMPKDGTAVSEDDLLQAIRRAITAHREVKVWNLSISRVSDVCRNEAFSDFAVALDALQERFDVTVVTCAGNYLNPPFRGWPAQPHELGETDRVHPPGDSIHAVTVGSLAHRDHATARVRAGEPSPFSRRGPGAAHLPKPEICHYGGNCDSTGDCSQIGILSVVSNGTIAEAVGTSFSTPLVASILANIRAGISETISRNLAKALLIHSAAVASEPVISSELHYRGFGVPGEIADILTCAPWQATLIFEPEIPPQRKVFSKIDFPIPACFRREDQRIEGEFLMTLVYDPPRDPLAGAEYCRVNVDVSLGTYDIGPKGKPIHEKQIPLQPTNYKELFERYQVLYGFKWSPVKVYRRTLQRTSGTRWRLEMRLLYRDEREADQAQRAALVVTMFDPKKQKPVYNDVVTAMTRAGWVTQDLRVDERIRARGRT